MSPEALARLHSASFVSPRPWTAAEFTAVLAGPGTFLLTEDAAFLVGRALAGEAELLTLAVPAEARRQGLGRQLLARFEAEAERRGAAEAFLEVAADNAAALALYAGAGWHAAGHRSGYYRRPDGVVDAVVLRRRLAGHAPHDPGQRGRGAETC